MEGGGFLFENLGVQYRAGEFVLCQSTNSPPYIGVSLCNAAVVREMTAQFVVVTKDDGYVSQG